jgi:hypothetical protein
MARPAPFTLADFARLLPPPPEVPISLEEMDRAMAEAAEEALPDGKTL